MSVLKIKDQFGNFTSLPVLKGDPGTNGAPGAQGTNGTNGTNGTDGVDGDSAYEVWLSLGNAGTEQDFINSLEGDKGDKGDTGASGTLPVDNVVIVTGTTIDLNLGRTFRINVTTPTEFTVVGGVSGVNSEFSVELTISGTGKFGIANNTIWENNTPINDEAGLYLLSFSTLDGGTTIYNTSQNYFDTKWELAVDGDFSGTGDGSFIYIGTKQYVILPHVIKGVPVTSYYRLFYNNTLGVKGVITTNKKIISYGMNNMFEGMVTDSLELPLFELGGSTDISSMFRNVRIGSLDLSKIDTSKITRMGSMFMGATIGEIIFGDFDTRSVTNMLDMFYNITIPELDLSSFNTENVTNMQRMFYSTKIEKLNLTSFDTKKVTTTTDMFYNCTTNVLDLSSFTMSGVTSTIRMFYQAAASVVWAKTVADATIMNATSSKPAHIVARMKLPTPYVWAVDADFSGTADGSFTYIGTKPYVAIPSVIKGVTLTSYNNMFLNSSVVKGVFSNNKNVTVASNMLAGTQQFDIDLRYFDMTKINTTLQLFNNSQIRSFEPSLIKNRSRTNMQSVFDTCNLLNIDMGGADTRNVTTMQQMFRASKITAIDLSSFDLSSLTNTGNMFQNALTTSCFVKTVDDANKINASSGKPAGLTAVVSTPEPYVLAVDADFDGTTNGSFVYKGSKKYVLIPSSIKGVVVTSYAGMFENSSVVVGVMNTVGTVTDMSNMFKGCTSVKLELERLDTRAVTNMTGMFENTTNLKTLNIPRFNTRALANTTNMFKACAAPILDLWTFDTATITTTTDMFAGCTATTGYAYTQTDADKFNATTNKPSTLNFVVRPY